MNLTVLGAGAWGTALAVSASARNSTLLWARNPAQVDQMRATRRNARYLGEVALPPAVQLTADFDAALDHAAGGLVVVATPMSALADVLRRLRPDGPGAFWLCKGFQQGSGWLGHEVARSVNPRLRVGVLSGPSFALEVARGRPTALVAASADGALRDQAVVALHGENLRIYTSADPVGVEVGGAVKNVLAIAIGIADGMPGRTLSPQEGPANGPTDESLGLGLNARAALITRGLAEMTRLGLALGGQMETFMGLSGLGDLVLTATGDLSRNRKVGLRLAQGVALAQILAELGHVAEGVASAPMVLRRAQAHAVEMPITQAVAAVLADVMSPMQALEQLMGRGSRAEV